jgi:fibrillarin-like rRNA methylase
LNGKQKIINPLLGATFNPGNYRIVVQKLRDVRHEDIPDINNAEIR